MEPPTASVLARNKRIDEFRVFLVTTLDLVPLLFQAPHAGDSRKCVGETRLEERRWDREGEAVSGLGYESRPNLNSTGEADWHYRATGAQQMECDLQSGVSETRWFAVWTRSRQEKVAASMLDAVGVSTFLPMKEEIRQWSDRKQKILTPLFSGYLFVKMDPNKDSRLQVLKTPGIAGFVGNQKGPLPIPDRQIEDIRTVLAQQMECTVLPFLEEGDRVRVVSGVLAGVEGRLLRVNSTSRLVISIELIQKSLAISVSRQDVEPVDDFQEILMDTASCAVA